MQVLPYNLENPNPFLRASHGIVGYEIRPQFSVRFLTLVDLTKASELRIRRKVSYTALLAKAVSIALTEAPFANSRLYRSIWPPFRLKHQFFKEADVTIAAEKQLKGIHQAVFIDTVRSPANRELEEISAEIRALQSATEENNVQWKNYYWIVRRLPAFLARWVILLPHNIPSLWHRYRGAAAFISSPGKYGVDAILTTWTAPLGFSYGFIKERPVVKDGKLAIALTTYLTMDFDRRIMGGAEGARLCRRVIELLENPDLLSNSTS